MKNTSCTSLRRALLSAAFAFAAASPLPAAVYTWDGGAAAAHYEWAANWSPNSVPPSSGEVVIGSAFPTGKTIDFTSQRTCAKLLFNSSASNVHLTYGFVPPGDPKPKLTITSGSIENAAGAVEIAVPLHLTSLGTWKVSNTFGKLTVSTPISGPTTPGFFDALVKTGSGTLELAGNNTFNGVLWVQQGKVRLATTAAFPANRPLIVDRYSTATNPVLELGANVTPSVSFLRVRNALLQGGTGSSIAIADALLMDGAEIDVVLTGSSDVAVSANAVVGLRRNNTFSGTITLGSGAELHIDTTAGLGATGNTVLVTAGEAFLVGDASNTLNSGKTLQADVGAQLVVQDFSTINAKLKGAGVISLRHDWPLTLNASSTFFTGHLDRDGDDLIAEVGNALGGAYRITLNGTGDLVLGANNVASSEPSFYPGNGAGLIVNSHSQDFGVFEVNNTHTHVQFLHADGLSHTETHGVIHFSDIVFTGVPVANSPNLVVTGWKGVPGNAGTDDRIYCDASLTTAELGRIRFIFASENHQAMRLAGGELVPKPL